MNPSGKSSPSQRTGSSISNVLYLGIASLLGVGILIAGIMMVTSDPPVNDSRADAIELTDLNNWCSADAAYTTEDASADESAGSCTNTGPTYNVWFKFQATSKDVTIDLKTGSDQGSLRYGYVSLWDTLGNEVSCAMYTSSTSDMTISNNALTVGDWYFISVDNHNGSSGGYRGTFTLCINAGLDYDWKEAAYELTDLNNYCSADAEFSTLWASADEAAGSCTNTGPTYNRWFKFQATSKDVTIDLKTGSDEGSLRYGYVSLWDTLGNEVSCAMYNSSTADMTISNNALTVGDWYFISVDNHNGSSGGYRGTFTLCVNAGLDYDWKEAAYELTDLNNWCSADAEFSTLWASADEAAGSCTNTGPTYNRWFKFQATSKDVTIDLKTGSDQGSLRYGYVSLWDTLGNEVSCAMYNSSTADMTISNNALTVGDWYFISVDNHNGSSGGYRGTFTLCVNSGLDYDWKEAAYELTDLNNWCSADAEFSTLWASADEAAGSCTNTGPTYNRWFKFQATSKDVTIDLKTGSDEGSLRYGYVSLWDTLGNEVSCAMYNSSTADMTISNNALTVGDWYFISVDNHNGSSGGYRGTFTLCVNAGLDYDWKEAAYELTDINAWESSDAQFTTLWASPDESTGSCWNTAATYNRWFKFTATGNSVVIRLRTGSNEGSLRYGYVSLWSSDGTEMECGVYSSSTSDIEIASPDLTPGAEYYISVDNHNGSSGGYRGTFSLSVDGSISLPVILAGFRGEMEGSTARLDWLTTFEQNNDFFAIERSQDGVAFEEIGRVKGVGDAEIPTEYSYADNDVPEGKLLYRLRQVDIDGTTTYSSSIELERVGELRPIALNGYPNPFTDQLTVQIESNFSQSARLIISDINGRQVKEFSASLQAGENTMSIQAGELPSGQYILTLQPSTSPPVSMKIVKR